MVLKCVFCKAKAFPKKGMKFNGYSIDGWKCGKCGEEYFDPDQAQRILFINKLKKKGFELKLNRVRSNLILRIPKAVSEVLNLNEKSIVNFKLKNDKEIVIRTS